MKTRQIHDRAVASRSQAAILRSFAVYAGAFFAHPVGRFVFGHLADWIGRVRILPITVRLMAGERPAAQR